MLFGFTFHINLNQIELTVFFFIGVLPHFGWYFSPSSTFLWFIYLNHTHYAQILVHVYVYNNDFYSTNFFIFTIQQKNSNSYTIITINWRKEIGKLFWFWFYSFSFATNKYNFITYLLEFYVDANFCMRRR